jgi:hypothetical protein
MIRRSGAALTAAAATVLLATGCTSHSAPAADAKPPTASSATNPAPSGSGPYSLPAHPSVASPLPSGTPGTLPGLPTPDDVDQHNVDQVAHAALTVLLTYDTALDTSRNDAGRRTAAAGWCTPTYAQTLREAESRSAPGADWTKWAQHRARTTVHLQSADEAGKPADIPTQATRTYVATLTPTGADHWTGTPQTHVLYAQLTRGATDEPWRLNSAQIQ